ncbi:MAG: tetratricopeptide repeat protein [bacterium]|nr:tetratricopeptide repeat protein [bacterium]
MKIIGYFLLACLWPLLVLGAVREASPAESADRGFVLNLIKDGESDFALKEIAAYRVRYPQGVFRDEMWYLEAEVLRRAGRLDEAARAYAEMNRRFPASPYREDALFQNARIQLESQNFSQAEALLVLFEREFSGSDKPVMRLLGQARLGAKDFTGAAQALQKAFEQEPKDWKLRLDLAWALAWSGQQEAAHQHFEALLKSAITKLEKAKIVHQLGADAYARKDYAAAYRLWRKQLEGYPDAALDAQSRFWAAEAVLLWPKAPQKTKLWALAAYGENLAQQKPVEKNRSLRHRGLLNERLGRIGAAEDDYARLQNSDVQAGLDNQLTLHRAALAQERGDLELARRILVAALGREPAEPGPLEARLRGLLFAQERCEEAILRSAERPLVGEGAEESAFWLGRCYLQGQRYRNASGMFASLEPQGDWAFAAIPYYISALVAQKRWHEALQWVERALEDRRTQDLWTYREEKLSLLLELKQSAQAVAFGEPLATEPNATGRFLFLLAQVFESRDGAPTRQRALELYKRAQKSFTSTEDRRASLERRRRILSQGPDAAALLALYQEALPLESDPAAKRALRLEIARLQSSLGQSVSAELSNLAQGQDDPAAEAWALLAEEEIAKKAWAQALKALGEGLSRAQDQDLRWRLLYRRAQVAQAAEDWPAALADYQSLTKQANPFKRQATKQVQAITAYLKGTP